jgi:tetratricopeptide (TPR) repeat protein
MGTIESAMGREREAREHYDEALALLDRLGAKTGNLITGLNHRAEQSAKLGKCADAIADFQRAQRVARELQGDHPRIGMYLLVGEAACHLHDHHPADAITLLERALALDEPIGHVIPIARFLLGRALVDAGRDRAKGLAMARAARADVDATDRDFERAIAETDAWLRAQR